MQSFDLENSVENLVVQNRVKGFSFYILILSFLLITLGSLPFISIDVSSQARGIVRASQDNVPIISLISGNIIKVHMINNMKVKLGDTILEMDTQGIENQIALNNNLMLQCSKNIQDLEQMVIGNNRHSFQFSHNQLDYEKFIAQKLELQTKYNLANQVYERNKKLFAGNVIPAADFERIENDKLLTNEALYSFQKQQKAHWQRQLKEQIDAQKNYVNIFRKYAIEKNNYLIKAPISGTIINFKGYESKSFLGAATQLAEISPDDHLIVECQINPKDLGVIKIGQKVRLQMDAFNYNQWGFLSAEVFEIDQHPVVQNQEVYFRVKCSLEKKSMRLKNGYQAPIQKGMTLTARFFISRRSVFQLLFDKVDQWLNPSIKSA
ncbi:MAG: hypothetical protein RJA76_501 [Bacteroidota bacterium]|jgi:HlyD family secretion protein